MRDCPVEQCSFRNFKPTVLYSSAIKGPSPTTPALDKLTAMGGPLAKQHQFGTHDKFTGEARRFQYASATPSHPSVSDSAASLYSGTSGMGTNVESGSVDQDGSGLVQGKSDRSPLDLTPIADMSSQPQIKSRSFVAGLKVKWMSRRLRSRR